MCGVRDCRLRRGLLFSGLMEALVRCDGQRLGVNKGTDWDSGLAQDTEYLTNAKIAVSVR